MTHLKRFEFKTKDIRVIDKDGQPWFVASDVCKVLEIVNGRDTVKGFPNQEKDAVGITDAIGRTQQMTVISEPGLYRLIFQSRKKEAEEFKTWVVSEVLPQIRKTGSYQRPKSLEELSLEVITGLSAKIEEQKKALEEAQPKVEFYNTVSNSDQGYSMTETAKLLFKNIGRNTFYKMLKADHIVMDDREPYQQYIEQGFFRLRIKQIANGRVEKVPIVTGKGLIWLEKKYKQVGMR